MKPVRRRGASKTTPEVVSGYLYTDDAFTGTHVGSFNWFEWLERGHTFHHWGATVRAENRHGGLSWYAFKRSAGTLHKVYVGRTADLDINRLNDAHMELWQRCHQ